VDLVISGSGRPPQQRADALVEPVVWAGVRRRRVRARTALTNQLLGTLDLVFPGMDGCFDDLFATKVGPGAAARARPIQTGCTGSAWRACERSPPRVGYACNAPRPSSSTRPLPTRCGCQRPKELVEKRF
jgi:hypothetical protein